MSKDELFAVIHDLFSPDYRNISFSPTFPVRGDTFYSHPPVAEADAAAREAFKKLVNMFVPETLMDRVLITAFFLSFFWGGPYGKTPMFIIRSRDGRGSGKTSLALAGAALTGSDPVMASTKHKMENLLKRILSEEGRIKKTVIFDNEDCTGSAVSSSELASMITSEIISGHQMYIGEGSRPNDIGWVMTLNSPNLDSDTAERSVFISIKKPDYNPEWQRELEDHLRDNREKIASAALRMLSADTPAVKASSRWSEWENEVLAKAVTELQLPVVQRYIIAKREEYDSEAMQGEMLTDAVFSHCAHNDTMKVDGVPFISNQVMADLVRESLNMKNAKNTTAISLVKNMIDSGLDTLVSSRTSNARGFLYKGTVGTGNKHGGGSGRDSSTGNHGWTWTKAAPPVDTSAAMPF